MVFPTPIFPFGLQLVRTGSLVRFNYGMPLESTTNPSSRQQLKILRPRFLDITTVAPTIELFTELKDLVASTTDCLSIRFVSVRAVPNASVLLCPPLQEFKRINIYLNLRRPTRRLAGTADERHIIDEPDAAGQRLITQLIDSLDLADEETQARYCVWKVDGWDLAGQAHAAPRTRLWPVLDDELETVTSSEIKSDQALAKLDSSSTGARPQGWERQTNLRLLGGLINLRLESKKT
jgi:hypothetical protein